MGGCLDDRTGVVRHLHRKGRRKKDDILPPRSPARPPDGLWGLPSVRPTWGPPGDWSALLSPRACVCTGKFASICTATKAVERHLHAWPSQRGRGSTQRKPVGRVRYSGCALHPKHVTSSACLSWSLDSGSSSSKNHKKNVALRARSRPPPATAGLPTATAKLCLSNVWPQESQSAFLALSLFFCKVGPHPTYTMTTKMNDACGAHLWGLC